MSDASHAAEHDERRGGPLALRLAPYSQKFVDALQTAYAQEAELRRPFLWRAVAAGAGVALYFAADREPALGLCFGALFAGVLLAFLTRSHARAHALFLAFAFVAAGYASGAWRAARVAAPIVPRIGVGDLIGFVEEIDLRRAGARFVLRVSSAENLPGDTVPYRVRLTTRGEPAFAAGDFIGLKARLMPPARAALPGGYDFARDAYSPGSAPSAARSAA